MKLIETRGKEGGREGEREGEGEKWNRREGREFIYGRSLKINTTASSLALASLLSNYTM